MQLDKDLETWKQQASQIISFQSLLPHIWYHLWTHDASRLCFSFPDWQSNTAKVGKVDRRCVHPPGWSRQMDSKQLCYWSENTDLERACQLVTPNLRRGCCQNLYACVVWLCLLEAVLMEFPFYLRKKSFMMSFSLPVLTSRFLHRPFQPQKQFKVLFWINIFFFIYVQKNCSIL